MPRTIAEAGLVNEVRPLNQIADSIIKKIGNTRAGFKEAEVEILDS